MDKTIEPYYQAEAKRIIDSMFDCKVFNEKMTRDDMKAYEDLLAYYFQSQNDSTKKATELLVSLGHLK